MGQDRTGTFELEISEAAIRFDQTALFRSTALGRARTLEQAVASKSGAGGDIMVKLLRALAVAFVTLALSVPIAAQGIPDCVEALEGAVQTLQTKVPALQADVN